MKKIGLSLIIAASSLSGISAMGMILPPNDLHLEDFLYINGPSMTQEEFEQITDSIVDYYKPLAQIHGGTLTAIKDWKNSTVNAYASQAGSKWSIRMFGGLARRPEVTPDGFALVVCHELGHHFAGYPFYTRDVMATEGQSDYFATQSCARTIWRNQADLNAGHRDTVDSAAKAKCDLIWSGEADRDLCYRVSDAGYSLALLLSKLGGKSTIAFSTPDMTQVSKTQEGHPKAQCRLDTYFHGGLCTVDFEEKTIPGRKDGKADNSPESESLAFKYSCVKGVLENGYRPGCWFKGKSESL